jgi:hypothetical protein
MTWFLGAGEGNSHGKSSSNPKSLRDDKQNAGKSKGIGYSPLRRAAG